jgi:hypothetical protein
VDRTIDAATALKRLVGSIDDGIDSEPGDVALDDLDAVGHRFIGRSDRARIKGDTSPPPHQNGDGSVAVKAAPAVEVSP